MRSETGGRRDPMENRLTGHKAVFQRTGSRVAHAATPGAQPARGSCPEGTGGIHGLCMIDGMDLWSLKSLELLWLDPPPATQLATWMCCIT
jgi:hypothetical protein